MFYLTQFWSKFIYFFVFKVPYKIIIGLADCNFDIMEHVPKTMNEYIKSKILPPISISYGGKNGLNEIINHFVQPFKNINFFRKQFVLQSFFDEITNNCPFCFGLMDVVNAINDTNINIRNLIISEDISIIYCSNDANGLSIYNLITQLDGI